MRRSIIAGLLAMASACHGDAPTVVVEMISKDSLPPQSALGSTVAPRQLSARESLLIDSIVGMLPYHRRQELRALLSDPRVFRVRVPAHSAAQRVIDALQALRDSTSAANASPGRSGDSGVVMATVAMVDEWKYGTADAVAVRDIGNDRNVILVPRNASARNLAGGVKGLVRLQLQRQPAAGVLRLVIQRSTIPASWAREGLAAAAEDQLESLRRESAHNVVGIGIARTASIPIQLGQRRKPAIPLAVRH